jgi:hypothetical protein
VVTLSKEVFFNKNRILAQKETFKNKAINKLFRKVYKATGSCTEKGFKRGDFK